MLVPALPPQLNCREREGGHETLSYGVSAPWIHPMACLIVQEKSAGTVAGALREFISQDTERVLGLGAGVDHPLDAEFVDE